MDIQRLSAGVIFRFGRDIASVVSQYLEVSTA